MSGSPSDPTELAAEVSETELSRAWGLDEDFEVPARFSSGRIVTAAVAASLLAVVVAGAIAWQHLRPDAIAPTAETSQMVQATVAPTITAIAKPAPAPLPLPPPPPVTVTTVVVQAPTAAPDVGILTPEAIATWDQQFINKMIGHGYEFAMPVEAAKQAHQVCAMFERGQRATEIDDWVETASGRGRSFAVIFVSTAMLTYPNCP